MNQELDQNQLSEAQIVQEGAKEQKKQDSCGIDKLGQVSNDQKDKKKKKKDKKKKKKGQSIDDEEKNPQQAVAQNHDESKQGDKKQQVDQAQPQLKNNSFPNSQLEHDQQQKQELTNQQGQAEGNTLTDAQKQQVGENLSNQEEKPELTQQPVKENIQEPNTQEPNKQTTDQKAEDNSTNIIMTQQPQNEEPTEQPLQVVEQETQQKPIEEDKKPEHKQQPTTQLSQTPIKLQQKKDSQALPSKKKTSTKQVAGSKKSIKEKQQLAQLQLLLKDKLKQIKTLSNKNSKLQAKYIDLFKENKTIKKDSNTLIQSLISIVDTLNGNLQINYNDKKDHDNFNKRVNQLTSLIKKPSLVKEELINKWKIVLEMKISIQLFKKDQIHNQTIQTIQKQHSEQIQKQTTISQKSLQQIQKIQQTETEKLTHKITSLQTELQNNKLKHEKQLNTISQLHAQAISQLKESLKQQLIKSSSYQLDQLSSIHEEQLKSLYDEIEKLRNKEKQSQETLKQMDEKLDAKNAEVSKLMKEKLKLEHQINQLKVKAIQEEFDETQNFEKNQQQSINQRNEFLKIRQQLEAMMEKRDQFKSQISKLQNELQNSKSVIKKKDSEIEELLSQLNLLQKERNQSFTNNHIEFKSKQLHHSKSTNGKDRIQVSSQIPQHIEIKSSEQIPVIEVPSIHPRKSSKTIEEKQALQQQREEYLRNVFIRYMKALLKGQSESCQTLLSVMLKILKVPEKDRAQVEQLLNSKKKWWIF